MRKEFYESQPIKKEDLEFNNPLGFMNRPMDEQANYSMVDKKSRKQKSKFLFTVLDTFYFKSKVDRFLGQTS